jgi:hypothetical protein
MIREFRYVLEGRPKSRERRPVTDGPKSRKWPLYCLVVAAVGLLIAGGVAMWRAKPTPQMTGRQQLITASRMIVREAVSEGLGLSFAGEDETIVEALPDHKFMVSGWVDMFTPEGYRKRQNFSCVVYKNSNDAWVGEHISVIPQM